MIDLVASVFRLHNGRFLSAPRLDFGYGERGSDVVWNINAGGSRAYLMRFGSNLSSMDPDSQEHQNADSHFMMNRVLCALLLGGKGLFQAEAAGRIFLKSVQENPDWFTQLDLPKSDTRDHQAVYDWIGALCQHTMLRRAATDAHLALSHPHESGFFVYRGLEWLVVGEGRSWDDVAADIGVSKSDLRDFKKSVNVDHGIRHASRTGIKLRANLPNYATWVCALLDAINATRARLQLGYMLMEPKTVAKAVEIAMPLDPYP